MQGMPTVRVDDLIIHPRERDLIAGTHGRSIWILDDISPLEQMDDLADNAGAVLFDVRPATAWLNDIRRQITVGGAKHFRGDNPEPGSPISYWLKGDAGRVTVDISDVTGRVIRTIEGPKTAGLNRVQWDLRAGPLGRGAAGTGRAEQPAATAPATQPPAANPTANPPAGGRQGAGREDRPAATAQEEGRGAEAAAQQGRGGGGRGRGGRGGPPLPAGMYLVKVTVDGKVIGQKTVVIEADELR
jgi:hypothetical protein